MANEASQSATSEPNLPGSMIAGRYRLERKLGEGGMGEVWAATHAMTKKAVALKFLKGAARSDAVLSRRFLREARAASAVRHPNVVQVHDVLELPEGDFVIVMDLLRGEDLSQYLGRVGSLSLADAAALLLPALRGLRAAHAAGIVHRDLKPDNLFLDRPSDDDVQPKLLDFGIAKLTVKDAPDEQSLHLTQTGTVMGTPYYMSPEQVYGERDVDARSDVWSVGVIAYECLSGRRPFEGENFGQLFKAVTQGKYAPLAQVAPSLPAEVAQVVEGMLTVDRERRVPSIEPLMRVLARYQGAKPLSLPPDASTRTPSFEMDATLVATDAAPPARSRWVWFLVPTLLGTLGVSAIWWWPTTNEFVDAPQPETSLPPGILGAEPASGASAEVPVVPTTGSDSSPARSDAGAQATAPGVPPTAPSAAVTRPKSDPHVRARPPAAEAKPPPIPAPPPSPDVSESNERRLPGSVVADSPF